SASEGWPFISRRAASRKSAKRCGPSALTFLALFYNHSPMDASPRPVRAKKIQIRCPKRARVERGSQSFTGLPTGMFWFT
ncbi:MAG: hypothetical protein WCC08_21690, partial [Terrimicrobiaceae bacterium]